MAIGQRMPGRALVQSLTTAACVALALLGGAGTTGACYERHAPCDEHCEGNTRVSCEAFSEPPDDSHVKREDCGARRCIESFRSYAPYAACAIGRDLRCNPDIDDVFCDGETLKACHGGFVERSDDCTARQAVCVTAPSFGSAHEGRCVKHRSPDSRCASGRPRPLFCDGDFRATCFGQLVADNDLPCSSIGKTCVDHPSGATCE
ncbi:MAG: hypothetical protein JWP87_5682 [Labilithrix sp.]|nr:hypothetical protein [Labilithrix sp.]